MRLEGKVCMNARNVGDYKGVTLLWVVLAVVMMPFFSNGAFANNLASFDNRENQGIKNAQKIYALKKKFVQQNLPAPSITGAQRQARFEDDDLLSQIILNDLVNTVFP